MRKAPAEDCAPSVPRLAFLGTAFIIPSAAEPLKAALVTVPVASSGRFTWVVDRLVIVLCHCRRPSTPIVYKIVTAERVGCKMDDTDGIFL